MLTQIVSTPYGKLTPLIIEVPVAPGLDGPFLVSSSANLIWFSDKFPSGVVRAAVRRVPLEFLFREVVEKIKNQAEELEWGSVSPATEEGVLNAVGHLREYGFENLVILYDQDWPLAEYDLTDHLGSGNTVEVSWLPPGWAVVVPLDRAYLGTTFDFGEGKCATVIHNSSRGIAFSIPIG